MAHEYLALKSLREDGRYKVLQALWIHQISSIEQARDNAAKRGNETAWRYHAGKEAGFKLAMTQLEMAMADMEKKNETDEEHSEAERLLEELRAKREELK